LGVVQETIINWEVKGIAPCRKNMEKIKGLVTGAG